MQRFCLIWKQQFLSWNHIWSKPLRKLCKVLAINLIAHFIQLGLYGTTCNDWIFAFLIQWKFPYFIGKTKFWCKDLRHQLSIKKLKTLQFAFYFRCCCHFNFSFLALLYTIIFSPLSDVLLCKLKMDLANPKCFWLAANFRLSDFSSYKILNLLQLQEDKTWEEFGNWGSNSISTHWALLQGKLGMKMD